MRAALYAPFAKAVITAALLSILAACGSPPVGPSADEVRLDLQDALDAKYRGMIRLEEFSVVEREVLSETRVRFQVISRIALDEARVAQFKSGVSGAGSGSLAETQFFGLANYREAREAERFYKRHQGDIDKAALLYRKNGRGVWQLAGVVPAKP